MTRHTFAPPRLPAQLFIALLLTLAQPVHAQSDEAPPDRSAPSPPSDALTPNARSPDEEEAELGQNRELEQHAELQENRELEQDAVFEQHAQLEQDAERQRYDAGHPRGVSSFSELPTTPAGTSRETANAAQPPAPPDAESPGVGPPESQPAPGIEVSGAPGQGLTWKVGDTFSLNVRSRIQLRYQLNIPTKDDAGQREFEQLVSIGTARLWLSGNILAPELTYMIQLAVAGRDFRDGATSPLYDAYLDWKAHRDFSVRAGQFFVPFDRLRTVREWALQMADRPRPVLEYTLDRDMGVVVYSERFLGERSPLAWRLGAFGGGGTNLSLGREPGALMVGRVELRPLGPIDDDKDGDLERRPRPGLALGGAFAANLNTNRLRSTTGPTFAEGTTDYLHAAADLVFKWRGFALQGEYLWKQASSDELASTASDGTTITEYTRSGQGWVAQASYTLDPPFEVVVRLSGMYALPGTDPRLRAETASHGQEVGAGLNYYFNEHKLKLQADWIARMPHDFHFDAADHVVHLQLDVTL